MGIEIHFLGRLEPSRVEEFGTAIDGLVRSMDGGIKRSEFRLPDDVTSYVKQVGSTVTDTRQPYPRAARGELILVWKVTAPSFGAPFAIRCNAHWNGAIVLYETKNWGSAYPMVSVRERVTHDDCDPTIYEAPVCIRRSHELQGHLDVIRIVDLIEESFVPNLWVHDEIGVDENPDIESIQTTREFIRSIVGPASEAMSFSARTT